MPFDTRKTHTTEQRHEFIYFSGAAAALIHTSQRVCDYSSHVSQQANKQSIAKRPKLAPPGANNIMAKQCSVNKYKQRK